MIENKICFLFVPIVPLHHMGHMGQEMEIEIDIESTTPMFAQLIMQIKEAVSNDLISPGDSLPSIRQLANDLDLNHKTVAKAYRLLERDSVIQTRGHRGTFIHSDAKANSAIDLNEWVNSELEKLISEFKHKGVTDSEIRIAFANVLKSQ